MVELNFATLKKQFVNDAIKSKTPILAQYELTPRCNFDCRMCYIHNQDSNKLKDRELTTEQWKHIFDQACDLGLLYATLTGGECMLRDDFKELYIHLINRGVYVSVITNGVLLNDDMIEFFKTYPPEKLYISVYGSDEDAYLNLTGHRAFTKVFSSIERVKEANINFDLQVTGCSYIADDYINILRYLKENKLPSGFRDFLLLKKRDDASSSDHFLSSDQILRLSIERQRLYSEPVAVPYSDLPETGGNICDGKKMGLTCTAGNCLAFVNWEGKMYPCVSSYPYGGFSLLEMSYADAWEENMKCASELCECAECEGCAYKSACSKCLFERAEDVYSGHCNPDVCELTKRLVAAGIKKLDKPQDDNNDAIVH